MCLVFFKPLLRFRWLLIFVTLSLFGLAEAAQSAKVTWVNLGGPEAESESPSLLGVPDNCTYGACPLVVVSHPRGQTPERLHQSASFKVLLGALLKANHAVLLSSDGGPTTWGSPLAFEEVADTHGQALQHFHWNGRTYALGLSMGGLMALRSALSSSPYPISGLALIDAWANLDVAWHTSPARQKEIKAAYATQTAPKNMLPLLARQPHLPMLVFASPDDQVVPWKQNSKQVFQYAEAHYSEFVTLDGPHLGGNRFSPEVAGQLVGFFQRLEQRAKRLEGAQIRPKVKP